MGSGGGGEVAVTRALPVGAVRTWVTTWACSRASTTVSTHRSTPAAAYLDRIGPHATKCFLQRARIEQLLGEDGDYADLMNGQAADWDAALRDWFLVDAPGVADAVIAALEHPNHREIVERYVTDGLRPTLGLTHIWLIGFRRALDARNPVAVQWCSARFAPCASRHSDELEITLVALQRRTQNLPHTVDVLRERYRNPLAHRHADAPRTAADNRAFCELAYGTPSLAHWLEVGTNPAIHATSHFGWLSFLTFARREAAGPTADVSETAARSRRP
jgi:hypothetical protein